VHDARDQQRADDAAGRAEVGDGDDLGEAAVGVPRVERR
jgi:hypothetical protein